jgi:ribosome-associated protein
MSDVEIRGDSIRLGQLLKLAGIAESGAAAKAMLAEGLVTVNGEREERRGRQIGVGDEIVADGEAVRVV